MTKGDVEQYVLAAAAALELTITPALLPAVMLNFERLAGLAALVNAFPLGPEHEPGPRWEP